jgi:NAD(P)-dependent dehydrogenase (short-subunit alcohol dehydrogenase family)
VDLKLTGKVALVTGSTAAIGYAIAHSLASEGTHLYVNDDSCGPITVIKSIAIPSALFHDAAQLSRQNVTSSSSAHSRRGVPGAEGDLM